jgi:predicted SPOUT superfamily RNA methylase MTH1
VRRKIEELKGGAPEELQEVLEYVATIKAAQQEQAERQAAEQVPQWGYMRNMSRRLIGVSPRPQTRAISTPSQQHAAALRARSAEQARLARFNTFGGPTSPADNIIPRASPTGRVV